MKGALTLTLLGLLLLFVEPLGTFVCFTVAGPLAVLSAGWQLRQRIGGDV